MEIGQIPFFLNIAARDSVPDRAVRLLRMDAVAEAAFPKEGAKFTVEIGQIVRLDMKHIEKRIARGIHQEVPLLRPDKLGVAGRSAPAAGVPADGSCLEMGARQKMIQETGFPDARRAGEGNDRPLKGSLERIQPLTGHQ